MTTAHVFIATSLDGYIARPDGAIDWLDRFDGEGTDYGYDSFFAGIDALLMGRGTYEKVVSFSDWPYSKPVLVVSNSLNPADIPPALAGRVEITRLQPRALLAESAARGWQHVYVDGGQLIQSFLREGLIADMVISHIPVLLGSGLPLFGPLTGDVALRHLSTTSYPSGLVQSSYSVTG